MEFNDVVLVTTEGWDRLYVNNVLYEEDLYWEDLATRLADLSPMYFVVRRHLPSDEAYFYKHGVAPRNLADLVNYEVTE